jgi:chondroitin sulfate synthase
LKIPLKQGSIRIRQPLTDILFRDDANFNAQFYKASFKTHGDFNQNLLINFIVPLSGRFDRFQEFMRNFEEVCLKSNEKVSLKLVLFTDTNSSGPTGTDEQMILQVLDSLKSKYPLHNLNALALSGNFSRAIACQEGASGFRNDSLLTFIDVDISFSSGFLSRVRMSAIKGKQVYFPIVFSQYENVPERYSNETLRSYTSPSMIERLTGYWRQYGYGMLSLYKEDLLLVNGFNTEIVGWGLEDVDLFDKLVNANYSIFRSADPGLVHVYHGIECDAMLDKHRYRMCKTNFYSTYGSQEDSARKVYVILADSLK